MSEGCRFTRKYTKTTQYRWGGGGARAAVAAGQAPDHQRNGHQTQEDNGLGGELCNDIDWIYH